VECVKVLGTALRLSWADLWHEGRMSACTLLAVAAVLAPLLVLAGLRAGVVEGMRAAVLRDPLARQVMSVAHGSFDRVWLDRLAARPEVKWSIPRLRHLSGTLLLERTDGSRQSRVTVLPSAPGDPLLPQGAPGAADAILLSPQAAARLGVAAGEAVTARLGRRQGEQAETRAIRLTVQAIAPASAADREAAFLPLPLAEGIEDWESFATATPTDAMALPQPAGRDSYASFRAYAKRLEDVGPLVTALQAEGIETVSRTQEIGPMLAVDRALGRLLLAVAGVGGAGFLLSLAAGLWANVERKRLSLAGLRLMGLPRRGLLAFPVAQAVLLAGGGALLGCGTALAVAAGINAGFGGVSLDRPLCLISATHCGVAVSAALGGALLAASLAAWRASAVEPFDAVRGP
jgi:putative ABC transport system permease protein